MNNEWVDTELGPQMDRFFWAVGTDLPTDDPQIRYRLGTDYYEERMKEGPQMTGIRIRISGMNRIWIEKENLFELWHLHFLGLMNRPLFPLKQETLMVHQ
jgi:hypothetical protein